MADYIVSGQKGSGKSVIMIGRIQQTVLERKAMVATNMDLFLEYLFPPDVKPVIMRLPDRPTGADMVALGESTDSKNEKRFGDVILDELAIWLNAREWNDGGKRKGLLDYLVMSRKYHWNTFLLTQLLNSLDKQARGLLEHHISAGRTDRLRIPIIGWLLAIFGRIFHIQADKLPQVHIGHITYGTGAGSLPAGQIITRGKHLWKCYNTDQKYLDDYPHGTYCFVHGSVFFDTSGWSRHIADEWFNFTWVGRPTGWPTTRPIELPRKVSRLHQYLALGVGIRVMTTAFALAGLVRFVWVLARA
jgi:hypothetical protein